MLRDPSQRSASATTSPAPDGAGASARAAEKREVGATGLEGGVMRPLAAAAPETVTMARTAGILMRAFKPILLEKHSLAECKIRQSAFYRLPRLFIDDPREVGSARSPQIFVHSTKVGARAVFFIRLYLFYRRDRRRH
jgi:hypothetical protein